MMVVLGSVTAAWLVERIYEPPSLKEESFLNQFNRVGVNKCY
jgi:hypothetical protein